MLLHGHIKGIRPRGRPRERWFDVAEDCETLHLSVAEADGPAQDKVTLEKPHLEPRSWSCQRALIRQRLEVS